MSRLHLHKDELLTAAVAVPIAGQLLAAVKIRRPYESMPSLVLVDLAALSPATLAAVKEASSANISALDGLSRSERAIDLAVLKRSYVSMAASTSLVRALFNKVFNRPSNSSVPSISASSVVGTLDRSRAGDDDGRAPR